MALSHPLHPRHSPTHVVTSAQSFWCSQFHNACAWFVMNQRKIQDGRRRWPRDGPRKLSGKSLIFPYFFYLFLSASSSYIFSTEYNGNREFGWMYYTPGPSQLGLDGLWLFPSSFFLRCPLSLVLLALIRLFYCVTILGMCEFSPSRRDGFAFTVCVVYMLYIMSCLI